MQSRMNFGTTVVAFISIWMFDGITASNSLETTAASVMPATSDL